MAMWERNRELAYDSYGSLAEGIHQKHIRQPSIFNFYTHN